MRSLFPPVGPKPPAHDALPTLRLPRDRHLLPKRCEHCSGRLFDLDEDLGATVPSRYVCVTCSRELCWVLREH